MKEKIDKTAAMKYTFDAMLAFGSILTCVMARKVHDVTGTNPDAITWPTGMCGQGMCVGGVLLYENDL